jgi:thiamine biosynthesis lipoprotein
LQAVHQIDRALGSEVSITALHPDVDIARTAVGAALAELRLVESLMSIYRPESQLSRLNREGSLERPHPYLVAVMREAEAMSRRSDGAFDITVQPLWALYAAAQRAGTLPEGAAIRATLDAIDWRGVEVTTRQIRLTGRGTAVTLNGIAQGFAADRLMAALGKHGVEHALVNTGELASLGDRADGRPWTVGIQHPRRPDAYISLAALHGRCLATSGDYATSFSNDYRDNHLFDPRTGRSPERFSSVSMVAPTATLADAMSTAVFVLGPEKGLDLVRSTPGADALFVFKDGRTLSTEGFPETA